jgi:flagellar biosynthesis/type III secretory pathway protein FliH
MAISRLLEDFSNRAVETTLEVSETALEDQKLEAFEKGYQAGWEDCTKSQEDSARHISEDLSQNLSDLSFTYQEAYAACMAAIAPVLEQMVQKVLPQLAHQSLGLRVVELLEAEANLHGNPQVELQVAPANASTIKACLPSAPPLPVKLVEESTLADGQVHLRFGQDAEHEIDMTTVLSGLEDAITSFFHEVQPQLKETS